LPYASRTPKNPSSFLKFWRCSVNVFMQDVSSVVDSFLRPWSLFAAAFFLNSLPLCRLLNRLCCRSFFDVANAPHFFSICRVFVPDYLPLNGSSLFFPLYRQVLGFWSFHGIPVLSASQFWPAFCYVPIAPCIRVVLFNEGPSSLTARLPPVLASSSPLLARAGILLLFVVGPPWLVFLSTF